MPVDRKEREELAWGLCVLPMAARQLALLNKTGQVDFEINLICRTYAEWMRNIVAQFFHAFFGGMLFPSYDRVIAGYMTRQIATSFLTTTARHMCTSQNVVEVSNLLFGENRIILIVVTGQRQCAQGHGIGPSHCAGMHAGSHQCHYPYGGY